MNIVREEIQSILDENNIAQEQFSDFLQDKNAMVNELHIEDRLHGELDLSILEENGFQNVTSLIFEEGEIISIRNIPDHLEKLVCPYNLLTELSDLPTSLNYLDIQGNYLSELDMLSVPNLTYLNINENQIAGLEPLPKKLESLFANNNKLKSLDFQDVKNVKTVHISSNPITVIQNMPDSVDEFISEYNSSVRFENSVVPGEKDKSQAKDSNAPPKKPFRDALETYYKMKGFYEDRRKYAIKKIYNKYSDKTEARAKIDDYKHPCVKCGNKVGTVFFTKETVLKAKCGDETSPCSLNIELDVGTYTHLQKELVELKDDIEVGKENFIKLKLNSLFGYNTEEDTKNEYSQRLDEYNFFSELYDAALQENKKIYDNEERTLLLESKQTDFYEKVSTLRRMTSEYNETNNKEYLQLISEMYVKELKPLVKEIQELRYEHSEVAVHTDLKLTPFNSKDFGNPDIWHNTLHQYVASIDSMDSFAKKQEKVLAFNI